MSSATSATPTSERRDGPTWVRVLSGLVGAAVVALGLSWGVLTATGGRLLVVETPSMARTAPVGSLVVAERVDPGVLRTGDVISFRPPSNPRIYTHRIVEVTPKGFRTKGDLNQGPDGWVVPRQNVVGRARHLWFGLGYLLRMMPWLALGGFLTAAVAWRARRRTKQAVVIAGTSLTVSIALAVVRPLVGAVTTGFVPVGGDAVRMSAVGTGVLPIRVTSLDDRYVDLVAGQIGWVTTAKADEKGRYQLLPEIHLPWWGWVLMGLFCALPLIASLLVTREPDDEAPSPRDPHGSSPSGGRRGVAAALAVRSARRRQALARAAAGVSAIVVMGTMGVALSPTSAALTATVSNSTDTVRTRTFATCLDAMLAYRSGTGNGQLFFGAMGGSDVNGVSTTTQSTAYPGFLLQPSNTTQTTVTRTGCQSDAQARQQTALTLNGSSSRVDTSFGPANAIINDQNDPRSPDRMTWIVWFRTTTTNGGVLACPGDAGDFCADYTTYMDNAGHVVYATKVGRLTSPTAYNDGTWHMVASQSDKMTGMKLWVDGVLVGSNSITTKSSFYYGYPQFGYSMAGSTSAPLYTNQPRNFFFQGDMQMFTVIGSVGADDITDLGGRNITQQDVTYIYESSKP